jgi:hypothetical protein
VLGNITPTRSPGSIPALSSSVATRAAALSNGAVVACSWRRLRLVLNRPLAEIVETVDWVFITCDEYLPESAVNRKNDQKLTRLRQILNSYDALRGSPPPSDARRIQATCRARIAGSPWPS